METAQERESRIRQLEERRRERRGQGGTVWPTPDDAGTGVVPIEIAPGRGDLNLPAAGYIPTFPTALGLVSGKTVSFARLFQSQPWVAAAVMRILTWSVRVPLKVYRKTGDENSRVRLGPKDHPLAAAVEAPWDGGSMAQLTMNLLGPVLVHGNSVTPVESGPSESLVFSPKDWRFCRPLMPFRDQLAGFEFDVDYPAFTFTRSVDQVIHIAWWSPIGPIGTSPLMQLGITMNIEDAAQRYQRALFQNGARPPSAVTMSDDFLDIPKAERDQMMSQFRADIERVYGGPENQGRPALLPPGLDWKPMANGTAVEAALIDQRKITREEVAAVYLIPPPMLGILDRATFSNIDIQRDMVYTDCLGPPLVLVEQSINSQVIRTMLAEDDVYCEYDFGGVLRGDRLAEIQALRDAIGSALITPNEGRDVLNRPRDTNPGMDQFYLPFNNLQPLGQPPIPAGVPPTQLPPDVSPAGRQLLIRSRDRDYELEIR